MYWLPPDVEYRIEVLKRELERALSQIPVFENGIAEEQENLSLHWMFRSSLTDAIKFLRETHEAAISLSEYKSIIVDLMLLDSEIAQRELAIKKLSNALVDKEREIRLMRDHIQKLHMSSRRGVVLEFRKKNDN